MPQMEVAVAMEKVHMAWIPIKRTSIARRKREELCHRKACRIPEAENQPGSSRKVAFNRKQGDTNHSGDSQS